MRGRWRTSVVSAMDVREFARFFIGGVAGAAANLFGVWLVRRLAAYQIALVVGLAVGFVVSFLMSKLFAFRSRAIAGTGTEVTRFMLVYAAGMACYFAISLMVGHGLLLRLLPRETAEMAGAVCGSAAMMLTSYFGHRFWTYRHVRRLP